MIYLDTLALKRYYNQLIRGGVVFADSDFDFSKVEYVMVPQEIFKVFKELGDPPRCEFFGVDMASYRGFQVMSHPALENRIAWIDRKGVMLGVTIIDEVRKG